MRQIRARRTTRRARLTRIVAVALAWLASLPGGPARPGACVAQVTAPAPAPDQGAEAGRRVADLTTRYRFIERYAPAEDPAHPGAIVQARVAIRETLKVEVDNPRGAPDRHQFVAQTIYTERPAALGPDGAPTATVRRYDTYRLTPEAPGSKPSDPRLLEGLSVWYQLQTGGEPLVLSLTEGRRLRENEFAIIRGQVYLPELAAVLPSLPSRIGDRWPVPRGAARALLGEKPPPGETLTATFQDLRAEANGPNLVALIHVTGQVNLAGGGTAVNALLQFVFPPPAGAGDGDGNSAGAATVDARGMITGLRGAQVTTLPMPGGNGRLRQTRTRELILARKRDDAAPLAVPDPKPTPTEANSWLTYVDPDRRFHLQHPQSLRPNTATSVPGVAVELVHMRPEGPDSVGFQVRPKTGDPAADRRNLDPEFYRKEVEEGWRQERVDMLPGAAGWLPEADWKPAGMRVYRFEAVLRLAAGRGGNAPRRVHFDYYLILTNRSDGLIVTTQTAQDPPTDFRQEAEAVIKTFRFDAPAAPR